MKFKSRLSRLIATIGLRAPYRRKPVNLTEIARREELIVNKSLDLGSGPNPKNPFCAESALGVDIRSYDINNDVKKCLLGYESLPFNDESFDAVTAYDILEHIPRVASSADENNFPFVFLMNEIWRLLRVGGLFYSETPCFPMKEAFQDPTHVNIMTEDTLRLYFAERAWARIYGFKGSFRMLGEGWKGSHYFCVLQKSSETPVDDINTLQK
jgi:SAM-dependent methyltransferase